MGIASGASLLLFLLLLLLFMLLLVLLQVILGQYTMKGKVRFASCAVDVNTSRAHSPSFPKGLFLLSSSSSASSSKISTSAKFWGTISA
jgi:hypothetical protein